MPRSIVLAVLVFALLQGAILAAPQELVVFYANDTHGFIAAKPDSQGRPTGGMSRLVSTLGRLRKEAAARGARSIFVYGGDMFQGTPVVDRTKGECMIRLFNLAGLTASALGNHEFDYGTQTLDKRMAEARFPFLATNVTSPLPIGSRLRGSLLLPLGPIKVGLAGLTTPTTRFITFKKNIDGVEFHDPEATIVPEIKRLRDGGADVIVLLTHLGIEHDRKLAQRLSGVDLIVGGHSHTVVEGSEVAGHASVVQAGDNARFLGEARLLVDPGHGVRLSAARLHSLCSPPAEPDAAIESIVQEYLAPEAKQMSTVVGELAVALPRGLKGDFSPAGALVTRAWQEAYGTPIALVNTGGIRRGLAPGPVTAGAVFELSPFGNHMVTLEISGRSLRTALERSVGGDWKPIPPEELPQLSERLGGKRLLDGYSLVRRTAGFLQASGLSYSFDPRRKDGERVVEVKVGSAPLDDVRMYRVVMSNYLADGGDNLPEFASAPKRQDWPELDREIVERYLQKHSPIRDVPEVTVRNLANRVAP